MADITYLQKVGDSLHLHYGDGSIKTAYPNGSGLFLVSGTVTEPPIDPEDPPTGDWVHPLSGAAITSPYGPREFDGFSDFHYGIDFSTTTAPAGGNVVAPTDMVITIARSGWGTAGSAGNCVKGHSTDGAYTMNFYHLYSIAVTEGATVTKGTVLGVEGATGNAFGTHLHFEMYEGNFADPWPPPYGVTTDPAPVLVAHGVTP